MCCRWRLLFPAEPYSLVAAAQAEADDREGNGRDAFEARVGIDPGGELLGELDVAAEDSLMPSRPK